MTLGLSLLDKAAKVCGSDTELARKLGVQRAFVSQMRGGRIKISPATAAEMADIAGEDARQAAIDSLIENAKGTRREGVLREVLGKGVAAGVVAMCLFSYSGDSISSTENSLTVNKVNNSIYIVEYVTRVLRQVSNFLAAAAKTITTKAAMIFQAGCNPVLPALAKRVRLASWPRLTRKAAFSV